MDNILNGKVMMAILIIRSQKLNHIQFRDMDLKAEETRLFQNPFKADVASCPDELQLDFTEFQANDLLRYKFKERLVRFCPRKTFLKSIFFCI